MNVQRLSLDGFRNYQGFEAEFSPSVNVIYGENAQGKTNLLEAVFYLSGARSHRARSDRELIGFEQPSALIKSTVFSREREFKLEALLRRGGRRSVSMNGVKLKTSAGLSEVLHTVLFCPEDLLLIRDGAAARRRFMDLSLCQLRPRYGLALAEYHRLYEHKTRILKDWSEKPSLLDPLEDFSERMARTGAILIHYRAQFCKKLSVFADPIHRDFSGGREEFSLSYRTVSTIQDPYAPASGIYPQLLDHMLRHRKAELESRSCLSGPHKDDLEVLIDGRSARQFASQGQTRTAALSMKLAERELHREAMGEYPVLLLDDVLSELDSRRQEFVLNRIDGGQIFITCCEDDRMGGLREGKAFQIKGGRLAAL